VTIFEKSVKRADEQTAEARNRFMLAQADEIVIGYARPGGMLEKLLKNVSGKRIKRLDF
jgi:hypothetical protein